MNTLEAKFFILDKAKIAWAKFSEVYPDCGTMPELSYEIKSSNCAGFAFYSGKVLFNLSYFCTHEDALELEETVAHELAHIVQYRCINQAKQAHGPEFKLLMQLAGYKGTTYHKFSPQKAKASIKRLQEEIILLSL